MQADTGNGLPAAGDRLHRLAAYTARLLQATTCRITAVHGAETLVGQAQPAERALVAVLRDRAGTQVGALTVARPGDWDEDDARRLADVADLVAAELGGAGLGADPARASDRLAVLADAGARLARSLRPRQVLEVLADAVVPDLAASIALAVTEPVAELLGLSRGNEPDRLHAVHVRHRDPDDERLLRSVVERLDLRTSAPSGVGRAVRTGRPEAHPRVPEAFMRARAVDEEHLRHMQRLNRGPQLTIPLAAPGGVLGAFTVSGSDERPPDEVLLVDLARRAAVALDNALSFARQNRAATDLQRALLPRTPSTVPGVEVATRYLPANVHALAGGDFFSTVRVDGRLVAALGDVMGHGTASAGRAGQLHGLVAALALQGLGPAELLTRLSAGIDQMMDLELATLLVCAYDPATRRLTAASAGHPPPLVAPTGGTAWSLELDPGPPIGVAAADHVETVVQLAAGDTVVAFSDGLVERRGESLTAGLERLRSTVSGQDLPPERLADHVLHALTDRRGHDDDIALLVLRHG